jgi:predicted nucleic acid-binding protein
VIQALADTSLFIAGETGRPLRTDGIPEQLGVSVITIGELRLGVLSTQDATARERRLGTLEQALSLDPIPIDQAVASTWARLRVALRDAGKRMPLNDSWIAATAMTLKIPVVTQDTDYDDVPGLGVIAV